MSSAYGSYPDNGSISETGNWLLIVRDADKLNNWSNLEDWIRDYRKTFANHNLDIP